MKSIGTIARGVCQDAWRKRKEARLSDCNRMGGEGFGGERGVFVEDHLGFRLDPKARPHRSPLVADDCRYEGVFLDPGTLTARRDDAATELDPPSQVGTTAEVSTGGEVIRSAFTALSNKRA